MQTICFPSLSFLIFVPKRPIRRALPVDAGAWSNVVVIQTISLISPNSLVFVVERLTRHVPPVNADL